MSELDQLYITLLHRGLVVIRNASIAGDLELCRALSEYLHEIPSLIGETNINRHVYQATAVRQEFLKWMDTNVRTDVIEIVDLWLAPVWVQLDKLIGIKQPAD